MYDVDPAYNLEILAPYTTYPHVPPLALIDPAPENRRGAPRRTVAVQNNSYHLPNYSSQNTNHRNEGNLRISSVRDRDGESPNKRRRIQSGRGDVGGGETDDYSTPRRGHAALDAEAYRPGGNTATRARQQGRKVREGRQVNPTPSTEGPSNAPETTGLGRDTGIAGMPTYPDLGGKQSNGRRTGHSTNPNPNPNPNPQPQPYPMSYNSYPPQPPSQSQSSRTQYNPSSTAYDSGAYQQQQNLNPAMDSVPPGYHHHHNSMNMNPNLNHMNTGGASGGGYSHPSGMGMLIPPSTTQLPPPPTSGSNGRPGSGNANLSRYDSANANGGGSRHRPDTLYSLAGGKSPSRTGELNKEKEFPTAGASAQGGLMPVPMLTSLPPPTTVTPLASLGIANHSPPPPPAVSNPEIHGRPRGYSGYGNGAYSDSAPQPTSGYGSLNASGYANAPGSATTAPSYGRESSSKGRDVHPSLMNIQKEYPSHTREPSLPSAGPNSAGSGVLHASLARDPPFRTGSAGSTDRDRAGSTGVMNRPRSGTASGGNPAAYHPSVDNHPGGGYDREQDNHGTGSSSAFGRHPSLAGGNGSGMTSHPSSHTSARYGYSIKEEIPNERERSDYNSYAYKRMIDVDEKPYGRDVDIEMTGADEKSTRAPIRRKHIDDTSRGSRGYGDRDRGYGGGGPDRDGEVIEVQTADEDSKPYCICRQPSFGQMIGCDDSECEFEWVRFRTFMLSVASH